MSLSIVSLLREHETAIVESIDLTLKRRMSGGERVQDGEPDPALDRFCPIEGFLDDIVAIQKIKEQPPTIAFIVAVDGDVPLVREQMELTQETMGYAKLAVAQIFTEGDLDYLNQARLRLAAGNPAAYEALVMGYVKTPAALTAMLTRLAKVLMYEMLCTGACTYIDPMTNLGFQISYLSQVPGGNFPNSLAGGSLWSATTTSTPLTNLRDHLNNYYNNLYTLPPVIAMSSNVGNAMLNSNDTKLKIARMESGRLTVLDAPDATQIGLLPRPTIQQCRTWLQNEITVAAQGQLQAPEIIISDAVFYGRTANGQIDRATRRPYIPAGNYVFLTEGVMSGAFLPTATNDFQKTVAIAMDDKYKLQPRQEYCGVDTRIMPLVRDPRYLGGRRVAFS